MKPGRTGSQPCKDLMLLISKQTSHVQMLDGGHELETFKKGQVSMATVANEKRWVGEVDNVPLQVGPRKHVITRGILIGTLRGRLFSTLFCR